MKDFAGKTAVVTGAASGIGLGLARTFARAGMSLVLSDIHRERLDAALEQVRAFGAKAVAVPGDVSQRADVQKIADAAMSEFGALHIACNNAGVTLHGKRIWEVTTEEWDWIAGVRGAVVHTVVVHRLLRRVHHLRLKDARQHGTLPQGRFVRTNTSG